MKIFTIKVHGCIVPDLDKSDAEDWVTIQAPGYCYNSKWSANIGLKDISACVWPVNDKVSEFTTSDGVTLYFEKGDNPFSIEEVEVQELDVQYKILKRAIEKGTLNLEKHCDDTEFKWRGHTVTIGRLFAYNGHKQIGYSITFDGLNFDYDYELEKFEMVD